MTAGTAGEENAMKHSHVFMRFPGGLSKALSFTFDDGSEQDERLVGLLAENGLLATFNLNMGLLPPDDSFDFSTLDRAVFPAADWCQRRMSRAKIGRVFAESGMELACTDIFTPIFRSLTTKACSGRSCATAPRSRS